MNIQTVAENLRNTIAGKEKMLAEYEHDSAKMVIAGMLRLNIDELKRILQDVEQCVPAEPEFDESDSEEVIKERMKLHFGIRE